MMLASLNLCGVSSALTEIKSKSKPKPRPKPKKALSENDFPVERRRSSRTRGKPVTSMAEDALAEAYTPPTAPAPPAVPHPAIGEALQGKSAVENYDTSSYSDLLGSKFSMLSGHNHKVYSMDMSDGVLMAAGEKGLLTFYQPPPETGMEVAPALTAQLHKGWIGDARFASGGRSAESISIVSCANDKTVVLSKFTRAQNGKQATLVPVSRLTRHDGGVFSLSEMSDVVVSAGKDHTARLTHIRESALVAGHEYDEVFRHVVKAVQWRPTDAKATVFAGVGDDRDLHVVDTRSHKEVMLLEDAHNGIINAVNWSPVDEHIVMTSSRDTYIHLYDLRNLKAPLKMCAWNDHHQCLKGKKVGMLRPLFSADGTRVLAAGQGSDNVYSFNVKAAKLEACKYVGFCAQTLALAPSSLFAAERKIIWQVPQGKF